MRSPLLLITLLCAAALLFLVCLLTGSARIPTSSVADILVGGTGGNEAWRFIVMQSRLPAAVAALLCGATLAVCGLMLQAVFRNPLADPSIFGISSGASLGAAVVLLLGGGATAITSNVFGCSMLVAAAFVGAMAVTALIVAVAARVHDGIAVVIVGIMTGYLAASAVTLMSFFATQQGVRSFVVWGMGHFGGVAPAVLPLFSAVAVAALAGSALLVKPLNTALLGERYASALGINMPRLRLTVLLLSGVIAAVTTAFCGPIAFIGMASPHIARLLVRTEDYRSLMPATILTGAVIALACHAASATLYSGGALPVNAITPLVGAPVVVYIIMKRGR